VLVERARSEVAVDFGDGNALVLQIKRASH